MRNQEIRKASKVSKVQLWKVAEYLQISEPTMTRKLRRELSEEEKEKILTIINELSKGVEQ